MNKDTKRFGLHGSLAWEFRPGEGKVAFRKPGKEDENT
jgi:hypothetical protein